MSLPRHAAAKRPRARDEVADLEQAEAVWVTVSSTSGWRIIWFAHADPQARAGGVDAEVQLGEGEAGGERARDGQPDREGQPREVADADAATGLRWLRAAAASAASTATMPA